MSTRTTSADSTRSDNRNVSRQSPSRLGSLVAEQVPGVRKVGAPDACYEYSEKCSRTLVIATDHRMDHSQHGISKSFRDGGETTQQHPAQGACLGDRGDHVSRWEVKEIMRAHQEHEHHQRCQRSQWRQ